MQTKGEGGEFKFGITSDLPPLTPITTTQVIVMPNRLNLPNDLESLIEKREAEEDRRQQQRRADEAAAETVEQEQRSGDDRRDDMERREG